MAITFTDFEGNEKKENEAKAGMMEVLAKIGKANKYLNDLKIAFQDGSLNSKPKDFEKPYITWFGALDGNRINQVAANIHKTLRQLTESNITIYFMGPACEKGDYAYTNDTNHGSLNGVTVHLCDQYFRAPLLGNNSQTGTLIHEFTHIIFNTDDHDYGQKECKALAKNNPALAIDNADNYEYFIESQSDQ